MNKNLCELKCLFLKCRLEDILHYDDSKSCRLYLVFEFMQMDLKKYMDTLDGDMDSMLVKVSQFLTWNELSLLTLLSSLLPPELHLPDPARDCVLSC